MHASKTICLHVIHLLYSDSEQSPACAYAPVAQNLWTTTADPADSNSFPLGFRQATFGEDNNPAFGVRCVFMRIQSGCLEK